MKLINKFFFFALAAMQVVGVNAQRVNVNVECLGNGSGSVFRSTDPTQDRCGQQDSYNPSQYVSYLFMPGTNSRLSHLYVNNVDRMADVRSYSSGSSASQFLFSFSVNTSTSLQPVFALNNVDIPVTVSCIGSGTGHVYLNAIPDDRCGNTDMYPDNFFATYDFLPGEESLLAHLYVNSVDRLSDVQTFTSGSSTSYRLGFAVNTAVSLIPVFDRKVGVSPIYATLSCCLMPNPSDGHTVLKIDGINGLVDVSVYGIDGVVHSHQQEIVPPSGKRVELEGLSRGVYLVRVECAEGSVTKKLIVR